MKIVKILISATRGGVNMVTVTGGRLVVSGQKAVRLVFDSMVGEEEEITEAEMEAVTEVRGDAEAEASFYWRQTEQDVELWCYISSAVTKGSVQVRLTNTRTSGRTFLIWFYFFRF